MFLIILTRLPLVVGGNVDTAPRSADREDWGMAGLCTVPASETSAFLALLSPDLLPVSQARDRAYLAST